MLQLAAMAVVFSNFFRTVTLILVGGWGRAIYPGLKSRPMNQTMNGLRRNEDHHEILQPVSKENFGVQRMQQYNK